MYPMGAPHRCTKNGFIEPTNTMLIEMFMTGLEAEGLIGVPIDRELEPNAGMAQGAENSRRTVVSRL